MARSSKTEQVMNLVSGKRTEESAKVINPFVSREETDEFVGVRQGMNIDANKEKQEKFAEREEQTNKKRKTITRNLEINDLSDATLKNPALKIPEQKNLFSAMAAEKPIVSVVSMLINEQLGAALRRFNACSCAKCCQVITKRVTDNVEPVFISIENKNDAAKLDAEITRLRPVVIRALAKEIIAGKVNPYHNNT